MPGGLERLATERARRAARRHEALGTAHEGVGLRWLDMDAQRVRRIGRLFGDGIRLLGLRLGLRFDHHALAGWIPGKCQEADLEELDQRFLQRCLVEMNLNRRQVRGLLTAFLDQFQQVHQAVGQRADLDLLQRDADQGTALLRLQEEGSLTGLAHRAGHEALWLVEVEEASHHRSILARSSQRRVGADMATRQSHARRLQAARRSARRSLGSASLLGWLASGAVLVGLALVIGGPAAEQGVRGGSPSPSHAAALPIQFGTALDPDTNRAINRTRRFRNGDPFAYSVTLGHRANTADIYVEIARLDEDSRVVVQERALQHILPELRTFAFRVRTDDLLAAWGAGSYEMRIFLESDDEQPLATGEFTLIASPSEG
jgi:hypothetical protein